MQHECAPTGPAGRGREVCGESLTCREGHATLAATVLGSWSTLLSSVVHRLACFCTVMTIAAAALGMTGRALAEEVHVLAAGAVQKAVQEVVQKFEAATGHKVAARFDTVGALRDRVLAGETPDLVILSDAGLKTLNERGRLWEGRQVRVGETAVGICVPAGAPPLDVSTPEKLKSALQAATSIAHADPSRGATAGTHFRKVLVALGLEAELAPRITVVPFGGTIANDVAAGKFALGVSQLTEILTVPGVRGYDLPEPHALRTVYVVGLGKAPGTAGTALLALLTGEAGRAAFARSGFRP